MKAFINGRTLFGTPVKVFPPVYPSQMVSICCLTTTFAYCGDSNQTITLIFPRSISLILKFLLRVKWLPMIAAAASVAKSATSWKTALCVRGMYNHITYMNLMLFTYRWTSRATCLYYIVDNFCPGPSTEGTWRKGLSTCKTKWIQQGKPRIR